MTIEKAKRKGWVVVCMDESVLVYYSVVKTRSYDDRIPQEDMLVRCTGHGRQTAVPPVFKDKRRILPVLPQKD